MFAATNAFARNTMIFGVDNSSSSYPNNCKNNFFSVRCRPANDINGRFCFSEKRLSLNFRKANTTISLSLHYNGVNSYLFVNKTEIYRYKADNGTVNFPAQFWVGSISDEFGSNDIRGVSFFFFYQGKHKHF